MITVEQFYFKDGMAGQSAEICALHAMVDAFAAEMKRKLVTKLVRDGYGGWDRATNRDAICAAYVAHTNKSLSPDNLVDVANLAAMLFNMAKPEPPTPPAI